MKTNQVLKTNMHPDLVQLFDWSTRLSEIKATCGHNGNGFSQFVLSFLEFLGTQLSSIQCPDMCNTDRCRATTARCTFPGRTPHAKNCIHVCVCVCACDLCTNENVQVCTAAYLQKLSGATWRPSLVEKLCASERDALRECVRVWMYLCLRAWAK